ncbi:MAG: hypothetical protein WCK67_03345 [bacterium]
MVSGINSQQYQTGQIQGHHKHKNPQDMFNDLSKDVGADGTGISEDQLQTALKEAQSNGDTRKTKMLGRMIEDFDKLSGGSDKITADSMQKAMESMRGHRRQAPQTSSAKGNCQPCSNCGSCGKTQDPSTVTSDQLKFPIDIRV